MLSIARACSIILTLITLIYAWRNDRTTARYVWFSDEYDADANRAVVNRIIALPEVRRQDVRLSGRYDSEVGLDWVFAYLSDESVARVQKWPEVDRLTKRCVDDASQCLNMTKHEWLRQVYPRRPELAFISFPFDGAPDSLKDQVRNEYVFKSNAGRGSTVYMIEEGASLAHKEFDNVRGKPDRIKYFGPEYRFDKNGKYIPTKETRIKDQHGTFVLSKIVGKTMGVARNVDVVIAQQDVAKNEQIKDPAELFPMFNWLRDDWRTRRQNSPSGIGIINLSLGFTMHKSPHTIAKRMADHFSGFVAAGLLPVISSGNDGKDTPEVDEYPALFADPRNPFHVNGLLVVGAVDNNGRKADFSQDADFVKLWGPGVNIEVPDESGNDRGPLYASGTSLAAPAVAAQAGIFASDPSWYNKVANKDPKSKVLALLNQMRCTGQPRRIDGPPALTNDVDQDDWISARKVSIE